MSSKDDSRLFEDSPTSTKADRRLVLNHQLVEIAFVNLQRCANEVFTWGSIILEFEMECLNATDISRFLIENKPNGIGVDDFDSGNNGVAIIKRLRRRGRRFLQPSCELRDRPRGCARRFLQRRWPHNRRR